MAQDDEIQGPTEVEKPRIIPKKNLEQLDKESKIMQMYTAMMAKDTGSMEELGKVDMKGTENNS